VKSAFITGANQGLGNGFIEHLLDQGWQVFGGVRKKENLPQKANLVWVELELASDDSIANAVAEIKKKTNQIDLLINNAGINKDTATDNHKEKVGKLGHLERTMLQKMFDINAIAPMRVLQAFLPLLTAPSSFVINISSCRASFHDEFENSFANYGYRASKIALNMMTFVSTYDLPKNIQTFAVHPGNVRSGMNPSGSDDPKLQAEKIMTITKNWNNAWNGKFMRYDGTLYPL
jgi:NAD(P)-dependent dehydrogenase (short-subunit alcohol dehydrogenase family)